MIEVYQTYLLDVIDDIEKSKLCEKDMAIEKEKALEARKKSLGRSYERFPPWRKQFFTIILILYLNLYNVQCLNKDK